VKITKTEVFVLGDHAGAPKEGATVHGLAFVRIHTDTGLTGVSEIFVVPPGVARAVLDGPESLFGRLLIGEDPCPPQRLWTRLYNSMLHGNRRGWVIICLGAVDVALWDLYGKAMDRPVWQLLGGNERARHQVVEGTDPSHVTPYCTIISDRWDPASVLREQVERVVALRDLGYRAFKIEPMQQTPDTIVELTRRTRDVLGPEPMLSVDVGYLWSDVGTAVSTLRRLEEFDVYFFETPFPVDRMEPYAKLAAQTPLRLAAGEHAVTRWEFADFMDRGGMLVMQPYMTTCGGLTEAMRIVELAQTRGALVCPGNWSTHVLGAATVHLAAVSPITPYIESAPAEVYASPLRQALQQVSPRAVDGVIELPTGAGIGVELPDELIEEFLVPPEQGWLYHEEQ
jgi:L-alanine-DL-glutamate epimerase-like enolase superfamily enzyme|tara:strand:+ start:677 stop:1870 length:1194 start_codon:yes stop_codon:yes gene_type:complete